MDEKLSYTTIIHNIRKKLKLSLMEYCIADSIYHLSNNPQSQIKGWCYASKDTLAEFLGITSRTIFTNIEKLIKKYLVEKDKDTKYLRTTQKWYDYVVLVKIKKEYEETSLGMKKLHNRCEETSQPPMKKLHTNYEETSYYNNIYNNKYNNKIETILSHWNVKNNIKHKSFSDKWNNNLNTLLKEFSLEEILKAIDTYSEVLEGKQYRWSHRWTLGEFLQRVNGCRVFVYKEPRDYLIKEEKRSAKTFDIRKI